ncbi:putative glycoside hydrolase [Acidocella sp. KAb 2-4]|uniref:putative glycoside hydrolase n=1 Tax=Acidocella sp. KAb 2-4 TaxID=2885158 RepID=UPI001D079456|nr:putative glycoside hydrolase [Acidocella sp. KAb 2-4]MCB5944729.1 putative glycoside hydrolase [Acidocella sp. KAb 2-4]
MKRRHISGLLGGLAGLSLPRLAKAAPLQVVDAATSQPIPGATVAAAGKILPADMQGEVGPQGMSGTLFARAPGYRAGSFSLAALPADGKLPLAPFTPHALYLSVYGAGSHTLLGNALALARRGAVNALVVDIKGDSGLIPYPSSATLAQQDGARRITTIPDLAAFVRMLHAQGVYAIARIVTFKDNALASLRPDLAVHNAAGELFRDRENMAWTDPFQPEVRAYNVAIAIEAAQAGFDEIQFDYLRFPDASQALQFAQPVSSASRVSAIAAFLAEARRQLLPYNVYIAADIFGYVCWNRNDTGIGQSLEAIAANTDYISPMLYPSGFQYGIPGDPNPVAHAYDIVYRSLRQAQLRLNIPPQRFRPWLQAFTDYAFDHRPFGAAEIAEQTRAAADFGTDGWMLWNPRNDYSATGL